ncbi:MAG: nuclear transport factor 2 family protein [Myxococcales bacterium]|nr:nuclear transport factor 2 family protein [Myxococcales bacterium]MCB9671106.1 nuclear transport factor 2 family protein [Alphaproteobacteria bacterium]
MHPNEELITRFYTAFAARDAETMASCYHPDAHFEDPVFPSLDGTQPGDMWRMLCQRADDLVIHFRDVKADDTTGSAHWDADYTFSTTGRMVNNSIDATFTFQDGLIRTHTDVFDFWRWSRMALGVPGVLLGWSPLIRNKVRGTAGQQLERFIAKKAG